MILDALGYFFIMAQGEAFTAYHILQEGSQVVVEPFRLGEERLMIHAQCRNSGAEAQMFLNFPENFEKGVVRIVGKPSKNAPLYTAEEKTKTLPNGLYKLFFPQDSIGIELNQWPGLQRIGVLDPCLIVGVYYFLDIYRYFRRLRAGEQMISLSY